MAVFVPGGSLGPVHLLALSMLCHGTLGFHDCIQHRSHNHGKVQGPNLIKQELPCTGGLCVGMHNGPHEGGPASYPAGDRASGYTSVYATMTVPEMPKKQDGICYYIWTDVFFGNMGLGTMNQFVPQLILGNALDGSSGAPSYIPHWGVHPTWEFGAHYFFELHNTTTGNSDGHAAYGTMHPAHSGEVLFTSFQQSYDQNAERPVWTLKMGVVGDPSRLSELRVDQPYMGLGTHWPTPTVSWAEKNYSFLCVNSCWELYGAVDADHLPSSGSTYEIYVDDGNQDDFPWVHQWDEDEGANRTCATSTISESHNTTSQRVTWKIGL